MVKSWKYTIDPNRYLEFIQSSTSNLPEAIASPVELRDDAIVGLKVKRGISECLNGVFSRSVEIEFNLNLCPSDFVDEVLMPTREKRFRAGSEEYDVYLKCGLVVFFYVYGTIRFAGIHTDNYFDADIDVKRSSVVISFIELSRYVLECFDDKVQRLLWTGVYKTAFLQQGQKIAELVDLYLNKDGNEFYIVHHTTSHLLAFSINSVAELLNSVFDDLCTSLLARDTSWMVGFPMPVLYKRVNNTQGKEIRGTEADVLYVVGQETEQPFWFVSQNHKTFWDFYVDWCIACKRQVLFTYTLTDKLYLGTYIQAIETTGWDTYSYGEAKKVVIRPLNSDWVKVSLVEGASRGINVLEERRFSSASGDAKGVVCLYDTLPFLVSGFGMETRLVGPTHWQYKLFYRDESHPSIFFRACDLQVAEFDWWSHMTEGSGEGFVRAYKDYVNQASYMRGLLDYYRGLVFGNRQAIEIELEVPREAYDELAENHLGRIDWGAFFEHNLFSGFCSKGVIKEYSIDYIQNRALLDIIMVRQ